MIRIIKLLLIASSCAFLISCSSGGSDSSSSENNPVTACLGLNTRIINGEVCSAGRSAIVDLSLLFSDGQEGRCTGNVLSSRHVLTAAHCFVGLGAVTALINTGNVLIPATRLTIHPGVGTDGKNPALFNDVAILEVGQDLGLPTVPILLSEDVARGQRIGITGFGLDEDGNFGTKRGGSMVVSSISENHIFADFDGSGSNTCNGDSGGPATLTVTRDATQLTGLVGITSSGLEEDCGEGDTSLFANLQNPVILDFITANAPGVGVI